MGRIANCFAKLAEEKRKALIPYIVAGDPIESITVPVMHEMVKQGANIIELGVPFTDPEAEGPVIQLAHERALKNHTSLRRTMEMVAEFRKQDNETPVLLMGYVNPIEVMGYENFATTAAAAGVDATLLVNVPPEEGELLDQSLLAHGIDCIYLLAPTTTDDRVAYLASKSRGFVYYVSLKGTTGANTINFDEVEARFNHLKKSCPLPLVVGFGIKDPASAARVAEFADGSVVGTAVVNIFAENAQTPDNILPTVGSLIASMREAMDAG